MQENNPVPTPVVTPQVVVEQPLPAQAGKQSNFLIILLSVLLLLSVSIAGFFAYQTQKLAKELAMAKSEEKVVALVTPEPTVEPIATNGTVVDTTTWNLYINKKYGFQIKYPKPFSVELSNKYDSFTDELFKINGLDFLVMQIEPIKTLEKDPEVWWSMQKTDPFVNRPVSCYKKIITKSIPSRYVGTLDNAIDPVINFDKNVVLLRQSDESPCNEPPFNQIILVSTNIGEILAIQEGYSGDGEQILSTFKFTN